MTNARVQEEGSLGWGGRGRCRGRGWGVEADLQCSDVKWWLIIGKKTDSDLAKETQT